MLLVIPITMIAVSLTQSPVDEGLELAYLTIGLPILVLNMWEWTLPKKVMEEGGRQNYRHFNLPAWTGRIVYSLVYLSKSLSVN